MTISSGSSTCSTEVREIPEDSARYAALEGHQPGFVERTRRFLRRQSGRHDHPQAEWLDYHSNALFYEREFLSVIPGFDTTVEAMSEFFYQLLDGDGDGVVSGQDYFEFCLAHGVSEEDAKEPTSRGWTQIPTANSAKEEVLALVKEFYQSEDPNAPGNWFFGSL